MVAPFTGAWIEIGDSTRGSSAPNGSHPSRVRGLKSPGAPYQRRNSSVAPFTGAWIEIKDDGHALAQRQRRTLHGCVD